MIEQAMHQVLSVDYERIFSTYSYGFRPNKNAHQALKQAGAYVAEGKVYVIDLDLEKFFDEVNHHRLMWLLSTRIADERVLQLIHRYLRATHVAGRLNRTTHQRYATRQPAKSSFIQHCLR